MYSDKTLNFEKELPDKFKVFFDYINSEKTGKKYNQVIINWYEKTGSIKYHADCQEGLDKNEPITILTLEENTSQKKIDGKHWSLTFKPKKDIDGKRANFRTHNGMILTMNGRTQETHVHGIPCAKFKHPRNNRRISISFRVCEK
ncbi:MAG: hypothetical protein CMF62_01355 [Magnetococcales bacterium]|nr:hypothetical protein [Magnetococcales bacterium]MBA42641.1 hypothetical protein [Magnetococcales bacterium]